MHFIAWVNLIDVVATVTIAVLIFALSISRPADQARSDMAGIVRAIVIRAPRSKSGYFHTPSLKNFLKSHMLNRRWSSHLFGSPISNSQPGGTQ